MKEHDGAEQDHACEGESCGMHRESCEHHEVPEVGTNGCEWNESRAHVHGPIVFGVLECVPGLVCSNSKRADTRAVVHVGRESNGACGGVVVVGQKAAVLFDDNVAKSCGIENPACDVSATRSTLRGDLRVVSKP